MNKVPINILLVEDNPPDVRLLEFVLYKTTSVQFHLTHAERLEKALEQLKKNHFDIILLDLGLPDSEGLDTVVRVHEQASDKAIVVLTGTDDEELAVKAVQAGAQDYLVKGLVDSKLMVRAIRYAIQRKRVEEELRGSEARFRSLTQSANDAIIVADSDSKISLWNKGAQTIFGYQEQEILGERLTRIIPERFREAHEKGFAKVVSTGKTKMIGKTIELFALRKDGNELPVELTLSTWRTMEGVFVSAIIRDITERKRLENQLIQVQKLKSIGQLAAGIAHEINTPIQYVGDNIRFLRESFDDISKLIDMYHRLWKANMENNISRDLVEEVAETQKDGDLDYLLEEIPAAINQSLEGIEHVADIVRAMKAFSHPGHSEKEKFDVNKALRNTITVARNEWKYVANIKTDFDPHNPLVSGIPGEINQVFLNILINAAQAIAQGLGGKSEPKGIINIATRQNGQRTEIRISDTGVGIPEEVRSRVFDPFFTTKEVGKGTGQGLAISHAVVVEKHGGTIDFETEMGIGTTFTIRLPIHSEN